MLKKIIIALLVIGVLAEAIPYFVYGIWGHEAMILYIRANSKNVVVKNGDTAFIFISTGSTVEDVADMLDENGLILNKGNFLWISEKKNYQGKNVVPGKYEIKNGWSNTDLIDHLRAGRGRLEVKITFNNVRTLEEIAGQVGGNIEADSAELISVFTNPDTVSKYGFNSNTFLTLFIPDTYQMDWATDAGEFLQIITKNYKDFWNDNDRKHKATNLGLSQSEVTILASIVYAEQKSPRAKEWNRIAGLYINRLNTGMKLQSDPTVICGIGDYTIERVLNKHLEYDSPYNTYLYAGLPPGPINIPEPDVIDAVLNYEDHDYIYMCAKADNSGTHAFAESVDQHNENARAFRKWLDQRGIK